MKYIMPFILVGLTAFISFTQPTNSHLNSEFKDKLQKRSSQLLNECVDFNEVAGISAGIYMNGEIVWSDAAGYMDIENKIPAKVNMINRTASISKPMTAIAILQLMEKGLLNLDDPVQLHIPDFPVRQEGTITIKHLLEHSSGIKAYKNSKEAFSSKNYDSLSQAIDVFKNRDLAHAPGKGYQYTTYGYVVLGQVIENVSGLTYRQYMRKYVWDKAGMKDTDVEVFGQTYTNKSLLYRTDDKGGFRKDKSTNLSVKVPGGGIQSTVTDLLLFADAILEDKLITAESRNLMISTSGHKKQGNPYGLGWFLYADAERPSGRIIGHSGSQSGTATQLFIFWDKKYAVVVLSNTGDAWNNVFGLTDKLSDALVRPEDVDKPIKQVVEISNKILDCFVGKYKFESGGVVELSKKDNALYGEVDKGGKFRLYPESETHFFLRNMNIQVEFESSAKKATSLVLIQNGERHIAKR